MNPLLANGETISYQGRMESARADPTFDLIVQGCASGYDSTRIANVAELYARCDPDRLFALACRHRVVALVADALHRAGCPVAHPFRQQAIDVQQSNLRIAAEMERLYRMATSTGLDLLFVKGLTMAGLAYDQPMLKSGWDIDILVDSSAIPLAARMLASLGYTCVMPKGGVERWHRRRKESVWRNSSGLTIELHSRLADNPRLIPGIGMASERQAVDLGQNPFPTLRANELIAYSCVHGASSLWFRVKWLADLAGLLHHRHGREPADSSFRESVALGSGRAAGQAFLLAHDLFDLALTPSLVRALRSDRAIARLAAMAIAAMSAPEPTEQRFGTVPIRLSQLLLERGPTFAIGESLRQVRDMLLDRLEG